MASTLEVGDAGGGSKAQYMESGYGSSPVRLKYFSGVNSALRLLLLASSLAALVVLVTSKQTVLIPVSLRPQLTITVTQSAKFSHAPALIYLLVALSITTLYSIINLITSAAAYHSKSPLSSSALFKLMVLDLLMTAIMASATGAAASIAYTGLKGNSYIMWNKICNIFDTFCWHVGSSIVLALVASVLLLLLVLLSSFSIYRRSH